MKLMAVLIPMFGSFMEYVVDSRGNTLFQISLRSGKTIHPQHVNEPFSP